MGQITCVVEPDALPLGVQDLRMQAQQMVGSRAACAWDKLALVIGLGAFIAAFAGVQGAAASTYFLRHA